MPLFAAAPDEATALCIGASREGLEVEFWLRSKQPIAFEYPLTVPCVSLDNFRPSEALVRVAVTPDERHPPIECDLTGSYLYALATERRGSVTSTDQRPDRGGAYFWKSTIEIPWTLLDVRGHQLRLNVAVFTNGRSVPVAEHAIDLTIDDRSGMLALAYAPSQRLATPPPAPDQHKSRLHETQADMFYSPDQDVMLAAEFAENDSSDAVQRSLSDILSHALLPLPGARIDTAGPETLKSRTAPSLSFLEPSEVLRDKDVELFADTTPFRISKVSSFASGYSFGYSSDTMKAGAFYAVKQPDIYEEAYSLAFAIPNPGTPDAANASDDPVATIDFLHSVVASSTNFDDLSGIALSANVHRDVCISGSRSCVFALHFFASTLNDAHPHVTTPASLTPPDASNLIFAGQSGSYTTIVSPNGAPPRFLQIAETVGVQQPNQYFTPTGGAIQTFSALGGFFGHTMLSYGTGLHVDSLDVLGVRMTTPNGDVFTNVTEQVAVPFEIGSTNGWTANAAIQSETLSDRVAEMEQGLVPSYLSAVFPTSASLKAPVTPAIVRPQTQQDVFIQSPALRVTKHSDFSLQVDGGYQEGFTTNCSGTPVAITCATGHVGSATWALFANRRELGFGISTMPNMTIPQDSAIASTPRYFGSSIHAPGSATTYLTFTKCLEATVAYTNAAFPSGVPLTQKGSTASVKVYYPFHNVGVEVGYFNAIDAPNGASNLSGYFALLRIAANITKPTAAGCRW